MQNQNTRASSAWLGRCLLWDPISGFIVGGPTRGGGPNASLARDSAEDSPCRGRSPVLRIREGACPVSPFRPPRQDPVGVCLRP